MKVETPLQPNESVDGYIGRLAIVQGHPNGYALRNQLIPSGGDITDFERISGVPTKQLLDRHTLQSYTELSEPPSDRLSESNTSLPKHVYRISSTKGAKQAALCPECVVGDMKWFGFSWWRRQHQVRGVVCCAQHGRKLINKKVSQAAVTPATYVDECTTAIQESRAISSTLHREHAELVASLLDENLFRPRGELADALCWLANEERVPCRAESNIKVYEFGQFFADRWGRAEFESISRGLCKRLGSTDVGFESSLRQKTVSSDVFAVVAIGLVGDAYKALDLITSSHSERRKRSDARKISDQQFLRAYRSGGGNCVQAAALLGESQFRMGREFKRRGHPDLSSDGGKDMAAAIVDFVDGRTIQQACAAHDVDPDAMFVHLRQALASSVGSLRKIAASECKAGSTSTA